MPSGASLWRNHLVAQHTPSLRNSQFLHYPVVRVFLQTGDALISQNKVASERNSGSAKTARRTPGLTPARGSLWLAPNTRRYLQLF